MDGVSHWLIIGLAIAILLVLLFGSVSCKSQTMGSAARGRLGKMMNRMTAGPRRVTFSDPNFGNCAVNQAADAASMATCCSSFNPTVEDCCLSLSALDGDTSMFAQCPQCDLTKCR
jgi:hypothetical protein